MCFAVIGENLKHYQDGNLNAPSKEALRKLQDVYGQYKQARPQWFEMRQSDELRKVVGHFKVA